MITLSFDTSLSACSAAVVDAGANSRVLATSYYEPGKGHAEILLGMIDEVMSEAGVGFENLERLMVTIGPGSFTGVRVALSAARGFRLAHDIPICGLSTMQAIAANRSELKAVAASSPIAVIIDARRSQAYGQIFDAAFMALCEPAVIDIDDLGGWLEPWQSGPLLLMGSGAGLINQNDRLPPSNWLVTADHAFPDAACFAQVFNNIEAAEVPPEPLYLRNPDAKPQVIGTTSI